MRLVDPVRGAAKDRSSPRLREVDIPLSDLMYQPDVLAGIESPEEGADLY
jgi:hypothetical protein